MLMGMLCIGDDLLTLTSVQQPPDDGTNENYRETIYRLTHTDLLTGIIKHFETDNEDKAVKMLAAWAAADESPEGRWFEAAMDDLRSSDLASTLP